MHITSFRIQNFRAIRDLCIEDIEKALVLVGPNNTGKTTMLTALRAVFGDYLVKENDFPAGHTKMTVQIGLQYEQDDLETLCRHGMISRYRRLDAWLRDVRRKIPSFSDSGVLTFTWSMVRGETVPAFSDGIKKHNTWIPEILPKLCYIDTLRDFQNLSDELIMAQEDAGLAKLRSDLCIFDESKTCTRCFSCIGLINQKKPQDLTVTETAKLLDYKLYSISLEQFSANVNDCYHKNGGQEEILYSMNRDHRNLLTVTTEIKDASGISPISSLGQGMRSLYLLSLLEAYTAMEENLPTILMIEEPELFLHPKMQKTAGEILFRLSRKNQVLFTTHSLHLLVNFNNREIRQTVLNHDGFPQVRVKTGMSEILQDLGYTAGDFMNADFVFFVEGKQDKSRLPLLLKKYYAEITDADGKLTRTAIIATNSCSNIRTYANLKYLNQVYMADRFLMIRDGDGKNPQALRRSLCGYYEEQGRKDADLPRVKPENVLILRYYSFENYFLDPVIMAKIGVIRDEASFYKIFYAKWKEHLSGLSCASHLKSVLGRDLLSPEDVKAHMEEIRIYMRGHNLFDLFYGKFKRKEDEILKQYIDAAPKENFRDITDAIEKFVYFSNHQTQTGGVRE